MDNLGKYLRMLRIKNHHLIREVAGYIKADPAIISKIERGLRYPGREQVLKFAVFYQVDVNILLKLWLSDKLIDEVNDEAMGIEALQLAEQSLKYAGNAHRSDQEKLKYILEAIENIQDFTLDMTMAQFLNQKLVQHAVLMQFLIIGESIIEVNPSILQKIDYQWQIVKSFRNFIVQEDHNIKMKRVWLAIKDQVPELEEIIKHILNKEFGYHGN